MTLSVLLYALMVSTLVVLVGVLVVDLLDGRARRRRTLEDRHPDMSRPRCGWRSQPFTAQPQDGRSGASGASGTCRYAR